MNSTDKTNERRESRGKFALALIGFCVAALVFGYFAWYQIQAIREDLRWAQHYGRMAIHLVEAVIFALAALLCAALPVLFGIMSARKAVDRRNRDQN